MNNKDSSPKNQAQSDTVVTDCHSERQRRI